MPHTVISQRTITAPIFQMDLAPTYGLGRAALVQQQAQYLLHRQAIDGCNQQRDFEPINVDQLSNQSAWGLLGLARQDILQGMAIDIGNRGDGGYDRFASQRYGPSGHTYLNTLREMASTADQATCMEELIVDSGLMLRLPQFQKFLQQHPQPHGPWQARAAFSRSLGPITLYRGMALPPETIQPLKQHGLVASGFPQYQASWASLRKALCLPLSQQLQHHLIKQQPSTLVGASKQFRTAHRYALSTWQPGWMPVVLQIKLPLLDTLPWHDNAFWPQAEHVLRTHQACADDEFLIPLGITQQELRYVRPYPNKTTLPKSIWPHLGQWLCEVIYGKNTTSKPSPHWWQQLVLTGARGYERWLGHRLADQWQSLDHNVPLSKKQGTNPHP